MTRTITQNCPTCGRRLHIQASNANQLVVCPHCHGSLRAARFDADVPDGDWRTALVKRADELLARAAAQTALASAG